MPLGDDDPVIANDYSGAVFTPLELERIREIVLAESVSTIETIGNEFSSAQRQATRYDIDLWFNDVGEGTLSVRGEIDYSQSRDRNDIRRRVALRFGLAVPSTGGIFHIPVAAGYGCYDDDY